MNAARRIALICIVTLCGCLVARSADADPTAEEEKAVLAVLNPARAIAARDGPDKGAAALRAALEDLTRRYGPTHWSRAYALDDLARNEFRRRQFDEAVRLSNEAETAATAALGAGSARLGYFHSTHGFLSYAAGACSEARDQYAAAYEIFARGEPAGERALGTAYTLTNLLIIMGDTSAAEQLTTRAFEGPAPRDARYYLLKASLASARGAFSEARAQLDLAASAATRDSPFAHGVILEKARLAFLTSELANADRLLTQLISADTQHTDLESMHLRALVDGLRGRFPEAQAGYQTVIDSYGQRLSELAPPIAVANYNIAWTYRLIGDYSRSLLHFDKAVRGANRCMGAESAFAAAIYLERSALYLEVGRLTEALADADRGLRIAQSPSFDPVRRAYAVATRGFALKRIGRIPEAQDLFRQALGTLTQLEGDSASDLAPGYIALAEMGLLLGQNDNVIESAGQALRIRSLHGAETFWGTGVATSLLAAAESKERRWADYWRHATQLRSLVLKRVQIGPGSSEIVLRELRNSRDLVERVLDAAPGPEDPASRNRDPEVFETMQLPHLSALSAVGSRLATSLGAQDAALRDLLTQRTRVQEDLQAARAQLEGAVSPTRPVVTTEDTERDLTRIAQLEAQLGSLGAQLLQDFPRAAELMSPSIDSAVSLKGRLAPNEALYLQVVTDQTLHGALLTREGLFVRRSDLGRSELRRHVATLRRALDLATPLPRRLPFDHAVAHKLYDVSVGMFARELQGKSEIYVVPDDAFQSLPLGVLVVDNTVPAAAAAAPPNHFLIERFAITVLPSVGALHAPRGGADSVARKPFVGFGDPALAGTSGGISRSTSALASQSASGVVIDDLNALTPLPQTAIELDKLAHVLNAQSGSIHTGKDATETTVKSTQLQDYRVVSFATHGLMAGEFRGLAQPALVLTPPRTASAADDGLLTASEIVQLRLNADVVLLSACNTGRDDAGGGAIGLSALSRAFLYAGAKSVVISHWAVSSDATVPLLTTAMQDMTRNGMTKSRALQQAMIEMLSGRDGAEFRAPAFWAPFVLVGENAPASLRPGSERPTKTAVSEE